MRETAEDEGFELGFGEASDFGKCRERVDREERGKDRRPFGSDPIRRSSEV